MIAVGLLPPPPLNQTFMEENGEINAEWRAWLSQLQLTVNQIIATAT